MSGMLAEKRIVGGLKSNWCEAQSYHEVLEFTDAVVREGRGLNQSSRTGRREFNGTSSWGEARKLAAEGWPEGLEKVSRMSENIGTIVGQFVKKQEPEYAISGSVVDVGRYMAGEPECMMDFREEITKGQGQRIVKISIDIGLSAGGSTEAIFNRGSAAIALIDALETSGLVAEVWAVVANGYNHGRGYGTVPPFFFTIPIKRAGEALELDRLAYVLCHASMYRRHVFCWQEGQNETVQKEMGVAGNGYGTGSYDYPEALIEEGEIHIASIGTNHEPWRSTESATRWALDQLRARGVLTEGA